MRFLSFVPDAGASTWHMRRRFDDAAGRMVGGGGLKSGTRVTRQGAALLDRNPGQNKGPAAARWPARRRRARV